MPQVGILVGLLSTSIQSLGLTLQRKSHLLEDEKNHYEIRRPPYKRRRWQVSTRIGQSSLGKLLGR
jgi:magnesium transporter